MHEVVISKAGGSARLMPPTFGLRTIEMKLARGAADDPFL
jgi:hypothetical protein